MPGCCGGHHKKATGKIGDTKVMRRSKVRFFVTDGEGVEHSYSTLRQAQRAAEAAGTEYTTRTV